VTHCLRLYKDTLDPQSALTLGGGVVRAIYVSAGGLRASGELFDGSFGANSAFHARAALQLKAGHLATTLLRWELAAAGGAPAAATGSGIRSTLLLEAVMTLDPAQAYLLRGDRVDFPPGGEALTHTHRGGGIRCLLFGGIDIHTTGNVHHYGPLEPWYEAGPDPVYAAASKNEASAFARVMILPRGLLGKSSISYVNAEDLDKPKSQKYQVFIDTPIELPD
jgi:hypothetical protein